MNYLQELTHIAPSIGYAEGAGGAAGAQTVYGGIKAGYRIIHVSQITRGANGVPSAGADITAECDEYATADDTITNSTTDLTGDVVVVLFAIPSPQM